MESKPVLIAMMGLPRSGKSTISRELSKKIGAPIVSRDALRLAVHGQRYEPSAEPLIKVLDIYMIRALFGAGHEVVICDETNFSMEAREHLLASQWDTIWKPVLTDVDTCIQRAYDTGQNDLVPVIHEMNQRYVPLPSSWPVLTDITPTGTIVTQTYGSTV